MYGANLNQHTHHTRGPYPLSQASQKGLVNSEERFPQMGSYEKQMLAGKGMPHVVTPVIA